MFRIMHVLNPVEKSVIELLMLPLPTAMLLTISLRRWNEIQYVILSWFSSPLWVLLSLASISAVTLTMKANPRKSWIFKTLASCAVIYLLMISPVGIRLLVKGLTLFLPRDDGQPVDAVVVLGRGNVLPEERIRRAAEIWHNRRAPLILASGDTDAPQFIHQLLINEIPREALVEESCSLTTEENALLSAPLLQKKGVNRIILVTDSPHMLRSLLTFRSFGFKVIPDPISLPTNFPSITAIKTTLREYIGLISYALAGRFSLRPRTFLDSSVLVDSKGCAIR